MKIYTKTGDQGVTSLFGGQRVLKSHLRVEAYGTVDELNALLGVVVADCPMDDVKATLIGIQCDLFELGADLATQHNSKHDDKIARITAERYAVLEEKIDLWDAELPELRSFILPGGTYPAAQLHFARTICRRAERHITALAQMEKVNEHALIYLNRLSDLLFIMARYVNFRLGREEVLWMSQDSF